MTRMLAILFCALGILLFFSSYGLAYYFHPEATPDTPERVSAWWDLYVLFDHLEFFFVSVALFFFTDKKKDVMNFTLNILCIAAMTISGCDIVDRINGDTDFRPFWDTLMLVLLARSIYKEFKK